MATHLGPTIQRSRRLVAAAVVIAVCVIVGCAGTGAAQDRAEVLARTCAYLLERSGRDHEPVDPAVFASTYAELVTGERTYSSVDAVMDPCPSFARP